MEQYKRTITDKNENTYVIQKDSKTIGVMAIAPPTDDDLDGNYYELHYIYLHPDCFRQGIGVQAMGFVSDKARELGKRFINLWVLAENENTIKFYEKCGFEADGKIGIQNRGKPMEVIRMMKDLSS